MALPQLLRPRCSCLSAESFLISSKAEGIWSEGAKRTTSKTVQVTNKAIVATGYNKIHRDKDDAIPKAGPPIYERYN
jgi:hypothetical protein